MRVSLLTGLLVAALAAWPLSRLGAASSAGEGVDLAALVAGSELITEAQVLDAQSVRLPDGRIETRYSLGTITPLKGAQASIQEVRMPGGEVAGRGLAIPGLPRLRSGQRLILFLTAPTAQHAWRLPVGLGAGAFAVLPDHVGGASRVLPLDSHTNLAPQEHDDFLAAILAEVERQG